MASSGIPLEGRMDQKLLYLEMAFLFISSQKIITTETNQNRFCPFESQTWVNPVLREKGNKISVQV